MSFQIPRRTLLAAITGLVGLSTPAAARGPEGDGPFDCPTRDCGWVYDATVGDPEHGVPPGTPFENLPDDWACPNCGRIKDLW